MMAGRVLYLCGGRSFNSANPGRKIGSIVECWRNMGHEVLHVGGLDILPATRKPTAQRYGAADYHKTWYRRFDALKPLSISVSEYRDIQHDKAILKYLQAQYEIFKPDIVWERSCRLHSAGLKFATMIGVPYVLEWKDNIASYSCSLFRARARRLEKYKNESASYIVTESCVLRRQLIDSGLDAGKIIVAQNAVDGSVFTADMEQRALARARLGVSDATILVGYLGSYAWYHDTPTLVKAMENINKEFGLSIKCLMVGNGKEYSKSRILAEKYGLLDRSVLMREGVPAREVPGILAALDIAVLPGSTDIICPIKIQEYMAAGLPTIAPDYVCNREVIEHGVNGILFKPGDADSLAGQISILARNRQLRQTLGQTARNSVLADFSWEATWGRALQNIIESSKA